MSGFALPTGGVKWKRCAHIIIAAVVAGNLVGLAGNVATSIYFAKFSQLLKLSMTVVSSNNTDDATFFRASDAFDTASQVSAIQAKSEVAVLLLIILAFVVVGLTSLRRVASALHQIDESSVTAEQGRKLRLQIIGVTSSVFLAFLLRAVLSLLKAIGKQHQQTSLPICPTADKTFSDRQFCDAQCYDDSTHIFFWLIYETSFEPIVQLIASPLALLVALWGMTSPLTLQLMMEAWRGDLRVALVQRR